MGVLTVQGACSSCPSLVSVSQLRGGGLSLGAAGSKKTALSTKRWGHGSTKCEATNSQALLGFCPSLASSRIS